jgi:sigma54-dependent transcription regulator
VVLATHRDLDAAVRAGTFRDDLLARISTHTIALGPLRARPHRIVNAYLQRLHDEGRRYGVDLILGRDGLAELLDLAYDPASAWTWSYRDVTQSAERLAFAALNQRATPPSASDATLVIGVKVAEREAAHLRAAWASRRIATAQGGPWHELEDAIDPGALASMAELDRWKALYLWRAWRASGGIKASAWRWLVEQRLFEPVGPKTDPGKTFDHHWHEIRRWRRSIRT